MREKQNGITLIALVITIIILLILAGVTIATLTGDNGILTRAQDAKLATELSGYQEQLELYKLDKTTENINFIEDTLTAGKTDLNYNTKNENETGNVKTIITNISEKYFEKLEVIKGKLLINTQDKHEIKIAKMLGIEVNPYDIRDGVLWSSNGNLLLMDENTGSLTIPDSITAIGEGAFSDVEGLKTIVIPPTVKRIEKNAFKNNTTLENVIIQERDGEGMEYIGDYAFDGCTNLKNINFPDTITYIGKNCFRSNISLDNIKLPDNLEMLNERTFFSCPSLKNLELPNNLKTLGEESLSGTGLLNIKFPHELKNIGSGSLNISTLQDIDTSENLYYESKNGVLYSKDLKILVKGLPNITNIDIEVIVEKIEGYAFNYCSKLTTINLTKNIKEIGIEVFKNNNLRSITIDSDNNYFKTDENNNLYSKDGTYLYRVFDTGTVVIKDGVENIVRGALLDNGKIKSLILPESFIGNDSKDWGTFPTLGYLFLPQNVKDLYKPAYCNVKEIEVSIENNYLKSINNEYIISKDGTQLYWVKNDLTKIDIPDTVEIIKSYSMLYQTGAEEVNLPSKVRIIERNIAYYSDIKKVEIPSSINEISSTAFTCANNLKEVVIHKKEGEISGSPWGNVYGDRAIIWDK